MKQCSTCGETKSYDSFTKNETYRDGYMARCKACYLAYSKKLRDELKKRSDEEIASLVPETKTCSKCKETKKSSSFKIARMMKMPLYPWCNECRSKRNKEVAEIHGKRSEFDLLSAMPIEKQCSDCRDIKPRHCFRVIKKNPNGLSTNCIECCRKRSIDHHYKNREKNLLKMKIKYSLRSKEELREYWQKWRDENPQKKREHEARRYGLISDGPGVTSVEARAILDRAAGRCTYCGHSGRPMQLDHVVPLSKGGAHAAENLVAACKSCNCSKNDRDVYVFIDELVAVT